VRRARAHAKVTLSLRVIGVRADGYHALEALTVSTTEPHDELVFHDAVVTTVHVSGPFADGVATDDDNLVARALRVVDETKSVELVKGIPPGAGLGGGSADAAAVLSTFGGSHADAELLGSDVPFCLYRRPAWMRGRGEILEAILGPPTLDLVIAAPRFEIATPAVYRAWDELGGPRSARVLDAPDGYPGPLVNDLEPAAERVEPRLRTFRVHVEDAMQRPALLCGSGSAYAAWFPDPSEADAAAERVRAIAGPTRVWRARTLHD
jgi:4-diphosphocytidyl-2-C-methyl-D-erythritol kinase